VAFIVNKNFFVLDENNDIHTNEINNRLKARQIRKTRHLTGHSKTGESCKLCEEEKTGLKKKTHPFIQDK